VTKTTVEPSSEIPRSSAALVELAARGPVETSEVTPSTLT
jgi:hypothetical protein